MKNLWTTIMVKDLEESLQFYTEILDLKIKNQFEAGPKVRIAFLGEGETQFELIENKDLTNIQYNNFVSTAFLVDNIEAYMTYLNSKGIEHIEGPFSPNPHVTFIYVKDPNGYKIQLVQQR